MNPHIAPFLYKGHGEASLLRTSINFFLQMVKEEVQHRCTQVPIFFYCIFAYTKLIKPYSQLKELDIAPNFVRRLENVITQRYIGNITLAPELSFTDITNILRNPKIEFVTDFIGRGERTAWQSRF